MYRRLAFFVLMTVMLASVGVLNTAAGALPPGCWVVEDGGGFTMSCDCNSPDFLEWGGDLAPYFQEAGICVEVRNQDCQHQYGPFVQAAEGLNCGIVGDFGDTYNGLSAALYKLSEHVLIGFGVNMGYGFQYQDADTAGKGFCMPGPPVPDEMTMAFVSSNYEDPDHGKIVPLSFITWEIDWSLGDWWDESWANDGMMGWAEMSTAERAAAFPGWLYYCAILPGGGQVALIGQQVADHYWDMYFAG